MTLIEYLSRMKRSLRFMKNALRLGLLSLIVCSLVNVVAVIRVTQGNGGYININDVVARD